MMLIEKYCRDFCGRCEQCRAAMDEEARLDALYASLDEFDINSLTQADPDDPHTYALNHQGQP